MNLSVTPTVTGSVQLCRRLDYEQRDDGLSRRPAQFIGLYHRFGVCGQNFAR